MTPGYNNLGYFFKGEGDTISEVNRILRHRHISSWYAVEQNASILDSKRTLSNVDINLVSRS